LPRRVDAPPLTAAADEAIRAWIPSGQDAVITHVGRDAARSVTDAVAAAKPGATIVFVESGRHVRRSRALRRALRARGFAPQRIVLMPSLDQPMAWIDSTAPARVIGRAIGHFGFRLRWRVVRRMSILAREPFVAWWAPAQLHIVIVPAVS